jgi:alkylation response protein AidB-like acyl-CoA dehydrogenase
MDFRFSPEEEAFRAEVRGWLKQNLPQDWTGDRFTRSSSDREEGMNVYKEFAGRLASKGWVAPHWPKEYGGLGFSTIEQLVFNEEMADANAPIGYSSIGVGWAGPTIIVYGTEEQKKKFLPAITSGEVMWCQGFSEPNAGSDLANIQTRAVRDGDDYVVNGQKIWTSGAHYADWMILIARTDPEAPKHKGISYFLVDMKTPGLTTSPLIDMMDNHAFNEVFFENVRVPRANLLGEENRGWYISTTTLDFERSSIGGAVEARKMVEDLADYCKTTRYNGHRLIDETRVRTRLADAAIEAELGRLLSYRVATLQNRGSVPNYEASIAKLFNTDQKLRMARAGLEIMGLYGQLEHKDERAPLKGRFERQYLWQTGLAVGGGTTEIQKNIIAMRGLGLPRQ